MRVCINRTKKSECVDGTCDVDVVCSFVELYNEDLRDLLNHQTILSIREHMKGIILSGVKEVTWPSHTHAHLHAFRCVYWIECMYTCVQ